MSTGSLGLDPLKLADAMETISSPYYQAYAKIRAKLLDNVDAATLVEDATRQAGFVVGFNCCRELLLGDLTDLAALKAGAK